MSDAGSRSARWVVTLCSILGTVVGLALGWFPWLTPAVGIVPGFLALWALCVGGAVLLLLVAWRLHDREAARGLMVGSAIGIAASSSFLLVLLHSDAGWSS